ncbi:MAG: malto-oligosyltrehalose trehalohydrolase [Thermodesulfobacteriota bacterium]
MTTPPLPRNEPWQLDLGATALADGSCCFRIWAPRVETLAVVVAGGPGERLVAMTPEERGYFSARIPEVPAGSRYWYQLPDGSRRPDPASRWQPDGVHGPSAMVAPAAYPWQDAAWTGLALADYLLYEVHVGTCSLAGTFAGVAARLDHLVALGVTAVEIMPVAQFPGHRNWGYDGAFPFAVQNSYGGPDGLKALVDACHQRGLAVLLDVVYNHLGPEGNYSGCFGYYTTDRYRTPWGQAINFDGPWSDEVRHFVIANALYWITEYHLDGLRLDAVHGIVDCGARHILAELTAAVHRQAQALGRQVQVIAESDQNDPRLLAQPAAGGFGLDGQWNDDFHHALHVLLTGERQGYYQDFSGLSSLARACRQGFVVAGDYSAYRRRRHGAPLPPDLDPGRLVVFAQNHDQVGNRAQGDRLAASLGLPQLKLAAACVLLSPFVPLLFMGEEYGEPAPFPYFVSHGDPELVAAVRAGRRQELAAAGWRKEVPDPQDEATFAAARLRPGLASQGAHACLLGWYHALIALRRQLRAQDLVTGRPAVAEDRERQALVLTYRQALVVVLGFSGQAQQLPLSMTPGRWRLRIDSTAPRWGGPGSGLPAVLPVDAPVQAVQLPPFGVVVYQEE